MVKYLLFSLVVLVVVLGAGYAVYHRGYKTGLQEVQSEWEQQELRLTARVAELEAEHAKHQEEVTREAERVRRVYVADVAAQRVVYEQRLSQSARRAEVYRAQAEAGAVSSGALAAHAARLDRALEEGRGLVQELRGALGLREDQLRLLGEQLKIDRELAAGEL